MNQIKLEAQGKGSGGLVSRMRDNARPHASIPERRVDMWEALHSTFVREAKEAGTAGRPRCRTLFLAGGAFLFFSSFLQIRHVHGRHRNDDDALQAPI